MSLNVSFFRFLSCFFLSCSPPCNFHNFPTFLNSLPLTMTGPYERMTNMKPAHQRENFGWFLTLFGKNGEMVLLKWRFQQPNYFWQVFLCQQYVFKKILDLIIVRVALNLKQFIWWHSKVQWHWKMGLMTDSYLW